MKKSMGMKAIISIAMAVVYGIFSVAASIKYLLQHSDSYKYLAIPLLFFVIGLAIFLLPIEFFLRFTRGTGYYLSKMTRDEESGLDCAGVFYTLFGFILMLMPILFSIGALLFGK